MKKKAGRDNGTAQEEDGVMKQFLTALQTGLILFAMAMSGTGWASESRGDPVAMTGACYMQDALVQRSAAATAAYSVEHGRVVYR